MTLTINQKQKHLILEITEKDKTNALLTEDLFSYPAAKWNGFINNLCWQKFIAFVQYDLLENEQNLNFSLWPREDKLPHIWEFVNGMAINLGNTRLILIPSEIEDLEEFIIPQEWVDIPNWRGDYYLLIEVNLDEDDSYLQICGYTTYENIKNKGEYDATEGDYYLARRDIVEDFVTFWLAQKLNPQRLKNLKSTISISSQKSQELVEKLSKPSLYSPRNLVGLNGISKDEWFTILSQPEMLEKLYLKRLPQATTIGEILNLLAEGVKQLPQGWQLLGKVFPSQFDLGYPLTYNLCSSNDNHLQVTPSQEELVNNFNNFVDEEIKLYQATQILGKDSTNQEAIAFLTSLLNPTVEDLIQWKAIEVLVKYAPNHIPNHTMGKSIPLQIAGETLTLFIGAFILNKNEVSILARLYPVNDNNLPDNTRLQILEGDGKVYEEIKGGKKGINYIFSGEFGESFAVRILLNSEEITEYFTI